MHIKKRFMFTLTKRMSSWLLLTASLPPFISKPFALAIASEATYKFNYKLRR